MVTNTALSLESQSLETKIIRSTAPSAMDSFARQIIESKSPFSLKMDGVSPDILESDLIDAIKKTGVLDFVPKNIQMGLRIETSENSGKYCAKLEVGSHKLRVFLAQSANELDLEGEKAAYSEMRIYDGKGGRIEVEPPQTVAVRLTNTGTNMTVNNPLDPVKYDELKKATKNGPQLVVLYYHDGNEGTFNVENNADRTLGAMLNALISGDISITEAMEMLQDFIALSPESMELIKALAEYKDLLIGTASPEGTENTTEAIAELEDKIKFLLEQELELPDVVLEALKSTFETVQNTAQKLGLNADTPDLSAPNLEAAEKLVDLIKNLSQQLQASELDVLPPEIQDFLDNIGDIETLVEEHGRENAFQQITEAFANPNGSELSQTLQNIVLSLNNPDVQITLPQEALNQTNIFLKDHVNIVDTVVRQSIIKNLQSALENLKPGTDTTHAIENTIEQLQDGQDITAIDVDVLNQVKAYSNALVVENLDQIIQTLENTAAKPVMLANETLEDMTCLSTAQDITKLEQVSEKLGIDPDAAHNMIETITPEMREALAQADVNVAEVREALKSNATSKEGLEKIANSEAEISKLSPKTQEKLGEKLTNKTQTKLNQQETDLLSKNLQSAKTVSNVKFDKQSNVIDARKTFQQVAQQAAKSRNLATDRNKKSEHLQPKFKTAANTTEGKLETVVNKKQGADKKQMNIASAKFEDTQKQNTDKKEYNPIKTQVASSDTEKEEHINGTGCEGCKSQDCANCSKVKVQENIMKA